MWISVGVMERRLRISNTYLALLNCDQLRPSVVHNLVLSLVSLGNYAAGSFIARSTDQSDFC